MLSSDKRRRLNDLATLGSLYTKEIDYQLSEYVQIRGHSTHLKEEYYIEFREKKFYNHRAKSLVKVMGVEYTLDDFCKMTGYQKSKVIPWFQSGDQERLELVIKYGKEKLKENGKLLELRNKRVKEGLIRYNKKKKGLDGLH